jgi:hypothetical protein
VPESLKFLWKWYIEPRDTNGRLGRQVLGIKPRKQKRRGEVDAVPSRCRWYEALISLEILRLIFTGKWTTIEVPSAKPTETGSRASMCVDRNNNVYLILPGNSDSNLSIVKVQMKGGGWIFDTIWTRNGFDGEPLVDVQRLEGQIEIKVGKDT